MIGNRTNVYGADIVNSDYISDLLDVDCELAGNAVFGGCIKRSSSPVECFTINNAHEDVGIA